MNQPHVKHYDNNGTLTNPLVKGFTPTEYPNRGQRNAKPTRFVGNGKNTHITVTPTGLYYRVVQLINRTLTRNGYETIPTKRIEHYIVKH